MASAKAMARMDWTKTFVEASGLRPTASEAFMPIKPTPRAAPSAARPTVKLPVIYLSFLSLELLPFARSSRNLSFHGARSRRFFLLTNQQREHRCQQHEHQRLHQSHQQFQEIEWYGHQPAKARNQPGHGFHHVFSREDVAVETKAQRDRPEQDRNNLETARCEKHQHHEQL